jgi:phosphoribulokinase
MLKTITTPNHAPVISRRGTDDTFVELSFRRLGELVELVATRVEYNAFTGRYLRDELGREVVEEEDAENAAVDLEYIALQNLDESNDRGYADPCGFGEAVERELEIIYAVAAE